jgi:hypothetical protein
MSVYAIRANLPISCFILPIPHGTVRQLAVRKTLYESFPMKNENGLAAACLKA